MDAINDDINIPLALGILFSMVKETKSQDIYKLALEFDKVLGLDLDKLPPPKNQTDIPQDILDLVEKRTEAKKRKDFALADSIRDQINQKGYSVVDTRDGVVVNKLES